MCCTVCVILHSAILVQWQIDGLMKTAHTSAQMKHGRSCDIIRSSQKSCDFSLHHRQIVTIIMQHLMFHVLLIRMTNRSLEKLSGSKYQQVSWPVCSTHNEDSVIFSCRCSVLLTTGNTVGYLTVTNKRQQMIIFYFFSHTLNINIIHSWHSWE